MTSNSDYELTINFHLRGRNEFEYRQMIAILDPYIQDFFSLQAPAQDLSGMVVFANQVNNSPRPLDTGPPGGDALDVIRKASFEYTWEFRTSRTGGGLTHLHLHGLWKMRHDSRVRVEASAFRNNLIRALRNAHVPNGSPQWAEGIWTHLKLFKDSVMAYRIYRNKFDSLDPLSESYSRAVHTMQNMNTSEATLRRFENAAGDGRYRQINVEGGESEIWPDTEEILVDADNLPHNIPGVSLSPHPGIPDLDQLPLNVPGTYPAPFSALVPFANTAIPPLSFASSPFDSPPPSQQYMQMMQQYPGLFDPALNPPIAPSASVVIEEVAEDMEDLPAPLQPPDPRRSGRVRRPPEPFSPGIEPPLRRRRR